MMASTEWVCVAQPAAMQPAVASPTGCVCCKDSTVAVTGLLYGSSSHMDGFNCVLTQCRSAAQQT
jgi:hypothetical protein